MSNKIKKKHVLKLADHLGSGADTVDDSLLTAIADEIGAMKKKQFKALDAWALPILEAIGVIAGFVDDAPPSKFTFSGDPVKVKKKKSAAAKEKKKACRASHKRGVAEFVAKLITDGKEHTLDSVTEAVMKAFPDRTDRKATYRTVRSMIGAHTHPNAFERRWGVKVKSKGVAGNQRKGIEETRVFTAKKHTWPTEDEE